MRSRFLHALSCAFWLSILLCAPVLAQPGTGQTSQASIMANPNPVAVDEGAGRTTITWNSGGSTTAQVYVQVGGQPAILFAQGASGSQVAAWISATGTYEFLLYSGTDRRELLASVTVTSKPTSALARVDKANSPRNPRSSLPLVASVLLGACAAVLLWLFKGHRLTPPLLQRVMMFLFFLLISSLLCLHGLMIFYYPKMDFDTQHILWQAISGRGTAGIFAGDVVHPMILHLFIKTLAAVSSEHAKRCWSIMILSSMIAALGALWFAGRTRNASIASILGAWAIYLASPAIFDIAMRAEENMTFHALYILCIVAFVELVARREKPTWQGVLCVGTLNVLMAMWHLQPFLILMCGEGAYLVWRLLRRAPMWPHARALGVSCVLPVGVLAGYLIRFKIPVVAYYTKYYSLGTEPVLLHYLQVYCSCIYGYLAGVRPNGLQQLAHGMVATKPWEVGAGVATVLATGVFLLMNRKRHGYMVWQCLVALGFVFVYEPISSERWDAVTLCMAILLLHAWSDGAASPGRRIANWVFAACLLMRVPEMAAIGYGEIRAQRLREGSVSSLLGREDAVVAMEKHVGFNFHDDWHAMLFALPPSAGVRVIRDRWLDGERCYFLPRGEVVGDRSVEVMGHDEAARLWRIRKIPGTTE